MDIRFSKRARRMQPSAIRNKLFDSPDIISFSAGKPEASLFPGKELAPLAEHILRENPRAALQYSGTEGLRGLRKVIAAERMAACRVDTTADHIALTSGSQEGIELSARVFVDEGDVILVERPSYTGAFTAFQVYNPRYVGIPMDEHGMKMDALEQALRDNPDAKMIYTIPDFQNPTGITMGNGRRRRLAELAAEYRIPVVEDCPYCDLIYQGERHPSVKSFDREGWVVTLGSFSKTFCPGLRLGWICADPQILQRYTLAKQGVNLQCSTLDQYIALAYLQAHDLKAHIEEIRSLYRARRDLMLACIREYFPGGVRYNEPQGGFFVWLELREDIDTGALLTEAVGKAGVAFIPGAPFFADGTPRNFLRLSYSSVGAEEIREGMRRLGGLLTQKYTR